MDGPAAPTGHAGHAGARATDCPPPFCFNGHEWKPPMENDMAVLLAKRFIQRRDVKAQQSPSGKDYFPVTERNPDGTPGPRVPFKMADLEAHLLGRASYGHYLLDANDTVKLFAFDIDLEPTGYWVKLPNLSGGDLTNEQFDAAVQVTPCNPRESWRNRAHPGREWFKYQLRGVADRLSRAIYETLEIPVAAAYSGSKGIHVYGFTGPVKAAEAREAAEIVLDSVGEFELKKGKNFFQTVNQDPYTGFPDVSIEVFPKQESLSGKDIGNLMRLPLGRNLKSNDPTFFLDQQAPQFKLVPHGDPIALLKNGNPWHD